MPVCFLPASMAGQVQRTAPSSSSPSPRQLPVINLGRLGKDPATRALAIQDITRACREQGCFQVSACCLSVALSVSSQHLFADSHSELSQPASLSQP